MRNWLFGAIFGLIVGVVCTLFLSTVPRIQQAEHWRHIAILAVGKILDMQETMGKQARACSI